jgi:hypothetical protein
LIPSIEGLIVSGLILALAALCGDTLLIGLMISLAFGSTSVGTLQSLGGSSPLISIIPVLLILLLTPFARNVRSRLVTLFAEQRASWFVLLTAIYGGMSAGILPRLFQNQTTAFVAVRTTGVVEVPLAPVSGNITQTGYFVVGSLMCLALMLSFNRDEKLFMARRAFFAFGIAMIVLASVDLIGKLAGQGDVLAPIRTATFAFLTEAEEAGFWRITGGFSEASAFASAGLSALGFMFAYWRQTNSRSALLITSGLFILLFMSTSSTAIVGLGLGAFVVGALILFSAIQGRLSRTDSFIVAGACILLVVCVFIYLVNPKSFDPLINAFDTLILNKHLSSSGQERAYWNARSLQALLDTYGFGIGLGSSRSSNWFVSVLSQLGLPGSILLLLVIVETARPIPRAALPNPALDEIRAIGRSAQVCAIFTVTAANLAAGSPDPGFIFFTAVAVVVGARARLAYREPTVRAAPVGFVASPSRTA